MHTRKRINFLGDVPDQEESWEPVNPNLNKIKGSKVVPWRNRTVFLNTPFIIGTTSAQILQANLSRNYLLIQNNSSGTMYLVFNNNANIFNGLQIASGGNYEPYLAPFSAIYIIGSATSLNGVIIEGVLS